MIIELKAGDVVILYGPQMCGKTRLAEKLASERGSYVKINFMDLEHERSRLALLSQMFLTWVIDDVPAERLTITRLIDTIEVTKMSSDHLFPAVIICVTSLEQIDCLDQRVCTVVMANAVK